MDAEMASWKSTGTYVDEVPPPGVKIVSGMWIFRTFSPTPKMTTLRVLLHVAAQRDYELHSLDFSTAFLQGNLHEEIWLRRPPGFTGSFPPGTQWSLRRPVYGLRQAPREWHDTLRTTLAALGFAPSTADPSLFLRTDTLLPPFYIPVYVDDLVFATADTAGLAHVKSELQKRHTCTDLGELRSYLGLQITRDRARRTITLTQSHMVQQVLQCFDFTYSSPQATPLSTRHSLSALPSDESVEPSGPYAELVGCLITLGLGLVLGGRSPVVLTGHADASWVDDLATQRSSLGYTFSLGSGSVSWRSTRSSSVLSSSCEAEIYAGAMAAQELRWLTYLLTDLGEPPRSPPVLYVDNKAMLALCREHRLEHRMKHIALRYFLARELQQRGQLRLAYVASQANTADIFTKALQSCDHQRFCTMLEEQASGHQVQAQEPQLQCRTSYSAVSGDVEEFPEWLMEAVCGIDSSGADDASWLSNTLANLDRSAFCLEDVWDLPNHQDEVDHPQDQQGPWNKVEQAASPPHAPRNGADAPPPRDTALGHAASSSSSSAALSPPQDSKTEGEIVTEALQMSSHLSAGSSTQRDGKMGDVVGLGGKCGRAGALVDQERISCETAMAVSGRQCGLDRGNKMERVGAETLQAGTQQHHHLQRVYHPVFDVLGGGNSLSVWDFISCRD
ncbi:unnamed protein product [Closterium sp. NIES-53]